MISNIAKNGEGETDLGTVTDNPVINYTALNGYYDQYLKSMGFFSPHHFSEHSKNKERLDAHNKGMREMFFCNLATMST